MEPVKLSAKAKRLLERVAKHIEKEPRRLDMYYWVRHPRREEEPPPCGTVGCIAGWTVLLAATKERREKAMRARSLRTSMRALGFPSASQGACDVLGLPYEFGFLEGYPTLFYTDAWPEPFQGRYIKAEGAGSRERMAKVTAARIRHFINKGV